MQDRRYIVVIEMMAPLTLPGIIINSFYGIRPSSVKSRIILREDAGLRRWAETRYPQLCKVQSHAWPLNV